ncbi:MAG: ABC transporter substrate-binding protein [Polyangiaceae bacterium]
MKMRGVRGLVRLRGGLCLGVAAVVSLSACGSSSDDLGNSSGAPGSAGRAQTQAGASAAGTPVVAGASSRGAPNAGAGAAAGGNAALGGASAHAGSAGSAGGVGSSGSAGSSAGAASGGSAGAADSGPYPDITLAGLTTAVELAPVRLAATGLYPAKITVTSGGVDNLFGTNAPLVATNAETQALRSSVQHTNLRIIFTVCEGLYRVVAKKSSGISTLADLKGKTVDYTAGTSAAYFLHQMLGTVNLSESDVKAGAAPSANSHADAAAYWEPNMQAFAGSLAAGDAVEFQEKDAKGEYIYRELFDLHATAESLADPNKRRTIVRFVKSLIAASAQIRTDPSPLYPVLTGPTGTKQADLVQSLKYERYAGTLVSDALDVLVPEEAWHAKVNNRTARTREQLATLIDDSIVKEALAN